MARSPLGSVDFKAVAAAALAAADRLVPQWLPEGRRDGHEWKARNPTRADRAAGSFSVNLNTGAWADFATSDKGGDLVSLYAYVFGLEQLAAAREVGTMVGMVGDDVTRPIAARLVPLAPPLETKRASPWIPILPVPDDMTPAPIAHVKRGKAEGRWIYRDAEGRTLGAVLRFRTSDGGKEVLPFCYCEHAETKLREWRGISFPKPRPLYGLFELAAKPDLPVLVVEGEKCADVARELLGTVVSVTWPGGAKAAAKADWKPLAGRQVILWPDADSLRAKASKDAAADAVLPYLSPIEQPGTAAMLDIAAILRQIDCKVQMIVLPPPGALPDGWDIADAVQKQGWNAEKVRQWMREHLSAAEEPLPTPTSAGAKEDAPAWWQMAMDWNLLKKASGGLDACRDNVYLILKNHADWRGVIALDRFSNTISKMKPPPYQYGAAGEWESIDDARLGHWLAVNMRMPIRALDTITDGVRMAAFEHEMHPVKTYLESLVHDGQPRVGDWLAIYLGVPDTAYARMVGRFFLLGMTARILRPGCKMDYMLILEGGQGKGKSTALSILGGEWFADTSFDMKSKDAYVALLGKWLYEVAELDSFNRAESTTAKNFMSSAKDRYRAPYDSKARDWKRQIVFVGTTNQDEYFKDPSGNRRYWPVKVGFIDFDKLRSDRDQLFAEAIAMLKDGGRYHPTREEERDFFMREQEEREIVDPWHEYIAHWLSVSTLNELTAMEAMTDCLKFEIAKIGAARQEAMRIGIIMKKLNWTKHRRATGAREWFYRRPTIPVAGERISDGTEPF